MRINTVPVEMLADQHLIAEYNEAVGMQIAYYRRSVLQRKTHFHDSEIPSNYTLGKGHATFFYDKMLFVKKRWHEVRKECIRRGVKCTIDDLDYSDVLPQHMNDWTPSKTDILTNLARIEDRISMKPQWYKFHGKPIDWSNFYDALKK